MPDFYSALDVYLSPARIEGGPVPVFEAMSCGTPIVATRTGGVRDIVTDGDDGLLVPVDDADATVDAVTRLARDPELRAKMGRNARDTVVARMGWQEVSGEARKAYAAVFTGEARRRALAPGAIARVNATLAARDREAWASQVAPGAAAGRMQAPRRSARGSEVAHVDLSMLGVRPGDRILDLGCGDGYFTLRMLKRGYTMVSADLDPKQVERLRDAARRDRLPAFALRSDAATLPFATASFDAVVCREVLEHVADPAPVLAEIRRVLKPGRALCVTVPGALSEHWFQLVNPAWLDMAGHVHVYRRRALTRILERAGFRVDGVRGRDFFYSFFWFFHTIVRTRHDGNGGILENWDLAHRIQRFWKKLGNGRLKLWVQIVGDRLVPKCNVYYCVREED
jgi:SAM-dependent methyltransferase